jgi:hypothetical protein
MSANATSKMNCLPNFFLRWLFSSKFEVLRHFGIRNKPTFAFYRHSVGWTYKARPKHGTNHFDVPFSGEKGSETVTEKTVTVICKREKRWKRRSIQLAWNLNLQLKRVVVG